MIVKFAIRNLLKRPFLNLIKIVGLSLALSGVLLMLLFLKNELSYDRFHENHSNIYRFTITNPNNFGGNHFARIYEPEYIPEMVNYFPDIESFVRLTPIFGGVIKHNENFITIKEAFQCDSTFFKIFDTKLLVGNPEYVLDQPGSLVISKSFAKRVFGNENPIDKVLTLPDGQFYGKSYDFTVRGIMEDFPQNSHFHPEFIVNPIDKSEFNRMAWTYLLLNDNVGVNNIVERFKEFYALHKGEAIEDVETQAHLQNIADIHLHSSKYREIEINSNMNVIYSLSIAAFILLIIAFANYASLNIGMSRYSDKYIFVSKVLGASKWMSLKYFLIENVFILFLTIFLSAVIVIATNYNIQKNFAINLLSGNLTWSIFVGILFSGLGIIVSVLPLFKYIKINVKPNLNFSDNNRFHKKGINRSLLVLQYAISIILVVAVIVIQRQTNYAINSSMGANRSDNLICFEDVNSNVQKKFEVFKEELLKYNSIESVSAMLEPPGGESNDKFYFEMEGYMNTETDESSKSIGVFPCDYSFASIFKLNFLGGSNFSETNTDNEGSGEYIINESAMRKLNFTDPNKIVGKEFKLNNRYIEIPLGKIIGVVSDFHLSTVKKKIEPLVLFKRNSLWLINFVVSFHPDMKKEALSDMKKTWTKIFPEYPFEYSYVDSMYENVYKSELLQAKFLSVFTFMALFICSMGLLGLSLLETQRRTKEIGIRKVNGAKIGEIMMMLNLEFIKWIVLSFVFAFPISYFAMNKWLENYAYKTALNVWIFIVAGLVILFISLLTISFNSFKVASRNPVEALRYE